MGQRGIRRLFVLVVRAAAPAPRWSRFLRSAGGRSRPKRVQVVEPHGVTLEELLASTLAVRGSRDPADRALAHAVETLGNVVARETERAVDYLHGLRFEGRDEDEGEDEGGSGGGAM